MGGEVHGPSGPDADLASNSEDHPMPKALIVEDEPEANDLLAMLVQLRGYQTDSAYTGEEALEKVERTRPDLVFLDLMLPDINGYDVCRHLKSCRETSGIPVVMVTARLASENRLQGFRVGATDYVPKPYTPDQIFAAMAQAEAWKARLAEGPLEGTIPLDARSDVAHLREISRLWSLLLERTPLSVEAARGLDQILVDLATRAVEWGVRTGHGLVASLHYRRDHDGVVVTVRDESGWFVADPPRKPEGLGGLIARGRFDEVAYNDLAHQVVLTLLFSPA
jgi:DNA-binding response OmpR family regulator